MNSAQIRSLSCQGQQQKEATTHVHFNKGYGDPVYKQNGTGRDTYISANNGGLAAYREPYQ